MAHLNPRMAISQANMAKRANPQLETGELHPKGMNFMGPRTQLLKRFSLNYKGNVGTKNYFLPASLEDYFSIWHDLGYYIPNDYINYKFDVDFMNNQEKYGRWNKNKLLALAGISAQTLRRTLKNIDTLLSKTQRKNEDEEYEEVNKKVNDIKKSYDKFLDTIGHFELNKDVDGVTNKFIVRSNAKKPTENIKNLYKDFYDKLENYFNVYLPTDFNEDQYKLPPLNISNLKFKIDDEFKIYGDEYKLYNIDTLLKLDSSDYEKENQEQIKKSNLDKTIKALTTKPRALREIILRKTDQPKVKPVETPQPTEKQEEERERSIKTLPTIEFYEDVKPSKDIKQSRKIVFYDEL